MCIRDRCQAGKVKAAWAVENSLAEAVMKMSFGNRIGFQAGMENVDWYVPMTGAIVAELSEDINDPCAVRIGETNEAPFVALPGEAVSIDELLKLNDGVLESVYPTKAGSSEEVKAISSLMEAPAHPFCAIVGGSKVSSKIGVIKALIEKVDSIIIGGGMTYTFAAAQGGKVGGSICEPDMFPVALEILELAKKKGVQLVMSPDALIADAFSADANTKEAPANDIPDGWEGLDIGSEGKKVFREHILGCKTILWNGPVGVFEIDKFATGSKEVAQAIAEATKNGAYSLIGGGDSVACINKFGLADQVSYISTGGGALLEYIEFGDLPGVAAIRD